jgi:two-component system, cell cycle response regulator DivK
MDTRTLLTRCSDDRTSPCNSLQQAAKGLHQSVVPVAKTSSSPTPTVPLARILLLEDNDTSRQLMSDYLEYYGYDVLSLAQGGSFIETVEQFCPQIILLDLKLPDVDGFALLKQFQQRSEWQTIPVIVVSAFAFQTDQQRAFSLGARRYFVKPVNLSQLRQAISEEVSLITV